MPEIDVVATIDTGDYGRGHSWRRWYILDRPVKESHYPPPPDEILASIPARESTMSADREIDAPSGFDQLIGYLTARGAGAHDEDRAGRERVRIAVLAGVQLNEIGGNVRGEFRDHWLLVRTGGDHDVSGLQLTFVCPYDVTARLRVRPERLDVDPRPERRFDALAVARDEAHNVGLL